MKRWHFYRLADGIFTRATIAATHAELVAENTPEGCGAIAGDIDPDSMRVDLETGQVVDWQPPAPSDEHQWDADARRWDLPPEAAKREAERIDAQRRIEALELQQLRPLRELLIDPDSQAARAKLIEIEDEVATLRVAAARQPKGGRP